MKFTTLVHVQYANGVDEHVQCTIHAEDLQQVRMIAVKEIGDIAARYNTHVINMGEISIFPEEEPFGHANT